MAAYPLSGEPQDAEDADSLDEARVEAERIAGDFSDQWEHSVLSPEVAVDLGVSSDDKPLLVFSLNIGLEDDLDVDDYPGDTMEELTTDLRRRIAGSTVDRFSWIVSVATKSAAH
jgi:hypothetical protein